MNLKAHIESGHPIESDCTICELPCRLRTRTFTATPQNGALGVAREREFETAENFRRTQNQMQGLTADSTRMATVLAGAHVRHPEQFEAAGITQDSSGNFVSDAARRATERLAARVDRSSADAIGSAASSGRDSTASQRRALANASARTAVSALGRVAPFETAAAARQGELMLCVARLVAATGHNPRTPADEPEALAPRNFSRLLMDGDADAVARGTAVVALSVHRQYRFGHSVGF